MIRRARLLLVMTRPAVAVLLGLYAAIGLATTGHGEDSWLLARALLVVAGFLLFSVTCNDIADERIDAVNLAGDARRPLVVRSANRREMVVVGLVSAVMALGVGTSLGWPVLLVVGCGLAVSAAYSVRPIRVADRGAWASLLLPACYVAVPYLIGHLAASRTLGVRDLALLAGLYVTFIGRILLKDFRDVRGDALFGKRTFLVRHGRRATCAFSAVCLAVGGVVITLVEPTVALIAAYGLGTVALLALLRLLAADHGPRRDEAVIAALAIVGRWLLVLLLVRQQLAATAWACDAAVATVLLVAALHAASMWRHGPTTRLTAEHAAGDGAVADPLFAGGRAT